jgi:hypothetical protein
MKFIILTIVSALALVSNANASGCNPNQSGEDIIESISFKTSGTVKCVGYEDCTFTMNASNGEAGLILRGPKKMQDFEAEVSNISAQVNKVRIWSSCFADEESTVIEAIIDGAVFRAEVSHN